MHPEATVTRKNIGTPLAFSAGLPRNLRYKIVGLYVFLLAGGLWHLLGVLQNTMQLLAAPLLIALCLLLCFEQVRELPQRRFLFWCILVCGSGFFIELLGVKTGVIFGAYFYGPTLQPQLWGIPLAIGFAWLTMLLSSAAVAQYLLPPRFFARPFAAALLIAVLMVTFDLFMEPAATKLHYWTWESGKIPGQNYLAWFAFGFILSYIGLRLSLFKQKSSPLAIHAYVAQLGYFVLVSLS